MKKNTNKNKQLNERNKLKSHSFLKLKRCHTYQFKVKFLLYII